MHKYRLLSTTDEEWFKLWDNIQERVSEGSFFQYTAWLNSYSSYGVKSELLLILDSESRILAGMSCQYLTLIFGKYYFCNWGPVILDLSNREKLESELLDFFYERGKKIGSIAAQLNIGFAVYNESKFNFNLDHKFQKGTIISKFYLPKHFNIIDLRNKTQEEILNSFSTNGRRDVRASTRKGLKFKLAESELDVEKAYSCFASNAAREGYFIRNWVDQKSMLLDLFHAKRAFFPMAYYQDKLVGAIWVGVGAKLMHYIMGGVERYSPDLLTGYFLQWNAMVLAKQLGCDHYNISVGGSSGVSSFKKRFNPVEINGPGTYFVIYSNWKYYFFQKIIKIAEQNKSTSTKILRFINKIRGK